MKEWWNKLSSDPKTLVGIFGMLIILLYAIITKDRSLIIIILSMCTGLLGIDGIGTIVKRRNG